MKDKISINYSWSSIDFEKSQLKKIDLKDTNELSICITTKKDILYLKLPNLYIIDIQTYENTVSFRFVNPYYLNKFLSENKEELEEWDKVTYPCDCWND